VKPKRHRTWHLGSDSHHVEHGQGYSMTRCGIVLYDMGRWADAPWKDQPTCTACCLLTVIDKAEADRA
jgi:hypothetical protein